MLIKVYIYNYIQLNALQLHKDDVVVEKCYQSPVKEGVFISEIII